MKKTIALTALFILVCLNAQAQRTATWKGGTLGRPSEWNCPSNWKEGRVPDEFSQVVIPDVSTSTFYYPQISQGAVEVASLQCAPNARLRLLGNARLITLDTQPQPSRAALATTAEKADSALLPTQNQ